jgi:phosphoribosyl 1,2-cyclic phosphodiesterase
MRLKLWGIRGSLPSPVPPEHARFHLEEALTQFERLKEAKVNITARAFLDTLPAHLAGGYGGHTSCAEVTHKSSRLLIDAGSGLRAFSDLMARTDPKCDEYHLYFTHFHWDHLIGLPFFAPMYLKGKTVHCYGVHDDLEDSLQILFRKPNFPVPYEVVKNQVRIHKLKPREAFQVGELKVTPYQLDHPDPCWGARIEAGGRSLAWCVDTECTRVTREEMGVDIGLYSKADVMVFDAQYSFGEALEKISWGHSSGPIGIDLALREEVKKAIFVHHDPSANDEDIREAEEQCMHYYEELLRARDLAGKPALKLDWHFGREGETIEI